MPIAAPALLPRLSVTSISQYVRLENCERFLRFRLRPDEAKALLKRWGLTIQPLTPLLKDSGAEFERDVARQIARDGEELVEVDPKAVVGVTLDWLRQVSAPPCCCSRRWRRSSAASSATAAPTLSGYSVTAAAPCASTSPTSRPAATSAWSTGCRWPSTPTCCTSMAAGQGIAVAQTHGAVLCMQEDRHIPSLAEGRPSTWTRTCPFSMASPLRRARPRSRGRRCRLGRSSTISATSATAACTTPSACTTRPSGSICRSTPYLSAVEKRVLLAAGVTTLPQLAALMDLPEPQSGERTLTPAPGQDTVSRRPCPTSGRSAPTCRSWCSGRAGRCAAAIRPCAPPRSSMAGRVEHAAQRGGAPRPGQGVLRCPARLPRRSRLPGRVPW